MKYSDCVKQCKSRRYHFCEKVKEKMKLGKLAMFFPHKPQKAPDIIKSQMKNLCKNGNPHYANGNWSNQRREGQVVRQHRAVHTGNSSWRSGRSKEQFAPALLLHYYENECEALCSKRTDCLASISIVPPCSSSHSRKFFLGNKRYKNIEWDQRSMLGDLKNPFHKEWSKKKPFWQIKRKT